MGMLTETNILNQAKKGQGETNQRLDALLAAIQETNRLLGQIAQVLVAQATSVYPPQHHPDPRVAGQSRPPQPGTSRQW